MYIYTMTRDSQIGSITRCAAQKFAKYMYVYIEPTSISVYEYFYFSYTYINLITRDSQTGSITSYPIIPYKMYVYMYFCTWACVFLIYMCESDYWGQPNRVHHELPNNSLQNVCLYVFLYMSMCVFDIHIWIWLLGTAKQGASRATQ